MKLRLWITGLGAALLVTGGSLYVYKSVQDDPDRVILSHVEELKKGSLAKAYYLYTSDRFQKERSLASFREWLVEHPLLSSYKEAELVQGVSTGDQRRAILALEGAQKEEVPVVYLLVFERGEWKIDQVDLISTEPLPKLSESDKRRLFITNHLSTIKEGRLSKAWSKDLAKPFKANVSKDAYKEALSAYPILNEWQEMEISSEEEEGDLTKMKVALQAPHAKGAVEFWVTDEGGQYKLWAVEIESEEEPSPLEEEEDELPPTVQALLTVQEELLPPAELPQPGPGDESLPHPAEPTEIAEAEQDEGKAVVQRALDLIKAGSIQEVYEAYTSSDFKAATSLDAFKAFLKSYPEFSSFSSIQFNESSQEDKETVYQLTLIKNEEPTTLLFWVGEESGALKIHGIRVESSPSIPALTEAEKKQLVDVMRGELSALKDNQFDKAYHGFVSKEFEKRTSLEEFKLFVNQFPILKEDPTIEVGDATEEGSLKLLRVVLKTDKETQEADFRFILEDGNYKIFGIHLYTGEDKVDVAKIKELLSSFLSAIGSGQYDKAYETTSPDFKNATTLDTFKSYFLENPLLVDFTSLSIEGTDARGNELFVKATAFDKEGQKLPLEARLIFRENGWSLLGIRFEDADMLVIESVKMGTEISLAGEVLNPRTEFQSDDKKILARILILNGKVDEKVTITLEHLPSHSKIEPVSIVFKEPGKQTVDVTFTSPTLGWPVGDYEMQIETSQGVSKVYQFSVKK